MGATVGAVVVLMGSVAVGHGDPRGPMTATGVIGAAAGGDPLGAARRPAGVDALDVEPSAADMSGDDLTSDRQLKSDAPVDQRLVGPDPVDSRAVAADRGGARSGDEIRGPRPEPACVTHRFSGCRGAAQ